MFIKTVKQRLEVRTETFTVSHLAELLHFQWYRHAHDKDMPLRAIARLIQTMLYAKRFFPYYVYNILGGIEEDGQPCLST
jgi:20S proteasome alpha/beta subunit